MKRHLKKMKNRSMKQTARKCSIDNGYCLNGPKDDMSKVYFPISDQGIKENGFYGA